MSAHTCPYCGHTPKAPKAKPVVKGLADMTRDELYAHCKATAPIEDLRFFLHVTKADRATMPDQRQALIGLLALFDVNERLTIPRPEFYRRFVALQDAWRQLAAARWTRDRAVDRDCAARAEAWRLERGYDAAALKADTNDCAVAA